MNPETRLIKKTLDALAAIGVWAWRVNSGSWYGGRIKGAPAGTPDIQGILPSGTFYLEAKMPGKELSDDQVAWHIRAADLGAHVGTFHTVTEALSLIKQWQE